MVFRVPAPTRLSQLRVGLGARCAAWGRRGWFLLGACVSFSACGPSFEILAEGDLRFVHCDRLDLDPKIAPSHRLHCWREWRRMYTYGQTRDRVEYAQRRIAEVVSGDTESPFQLPSEQHAGSRHHLSAGAPPPALPAATANGSGAGALAAAPPSSAEETACRGRCEAAHATCAPGCETRPTGCQKCERPLEECLGDCKSNAP